MSEEKNTESTTEKAPTQHTDEVQKPIAPIIKKPPKNYQITEIEKVKEVPTDAEKYKKAAESYKKSSDTYKWIAIGLGVFVLYQFYRDN